MDYLGVGPKALLKRVLVAIYDLHKCQPRRSVNVLWHRPLDPSAEIIASVLCYPCPECNQLIRVHPKTDAEGTNLCSLLRALLGYTKLTAYLTHTPSNSDNSRDDSFTQKLALEYIIALSSAEDIRALLVSLEPNVATNHKAEEVVEAYRGYGSAALVDLCMLCLHSLSAFELQTIPMDARLMGRHHLGPQETVRRLLGLVTSAHAQIQHCNFDFKAHSSSAEKIARIAAGPCPRCSNFVDDHLDIHVDARQKLVHRLLTFIRLVLHPARCRIWLTRNQVQRSRRAIDCSQIPDRPRKRERCSLHSLRPYLYPPCYTITVQHDTHISQSWICKWLSLGI